jgi:glycosyltransferase involved in cell wall biosynthesis
LARRSINILGTRGVPGAHGGYETFASQLAPYLAERDWEVTVYCQDEAGLQGAVDEWRGVRRVHFAPRTTGPLGTIEFDARCIRHVMGQPGVDLVLGYNTALFNLAQRLRRRTVIMNMDGIEWRRDKWSLPAKAWFYLNEIVGAHISTALIADHPEIERHLRRRPPRVPITMIPYGADTVREAPTAPLAALGLEPGGYMVMIARVDPENSLLPIIRAFSREPRGHKLVVLGRFVPGNRYHEACLAAASDEVIFAGPIFDQSIVRSLRFHARAYLHGHTVGGTNPSLCEALGAGNAVIAHDNRFNRWTAGEEQSFFIDEDSCAAAIERLLNSDAAVALARTAAWARHAKDFSWPAVLTAYEILLGGLADGEFRRSTANKASPAIAGSYREIT